MPKYVPYTYRTPDSQYGDLLYKILRNGKVAESTRQGVAAHTIMQGTMQFDLRNGFPAITDRSLKLFFLDPADR